MYTCTCTYIHVLCTCPWISTFSMHMFKHLYMHHACVVSIHMMHMYMHTFTPLHNMEVTSFNTMYKSRCTSHNLQVAIHKSKDDLCKLYHKHKSHHRSSNAQVTIDKSQCQCYYIQVTTYNSNIQLTTYNLQCTTHNVQLTM